MKSYLVVFHVDESDPERMIDISDDPCFESPPTWGICRPPTRKYISIGDFLFFIGYYKSKNKYYVKGYFKVGDKISYPVALKRFTNRSNIIISKKRFTSNTKWLYSKLEKIYKTKFDNEIKTWLLEINSKEGVFYQNSSDNHQIDNWKCRRIYHCNKNQFISCVKSNNCLKDGESLSEYENYVVADESEWADVSSHNIPFKEFIKDTGFKKALVTPKHQHNILRCDDFKDSFLKTIERYVRSY